jgi:hypothetical protein
VRAQVSERSNVTSVTSDFSDNSQTTIELVRIVSLSVRSTYAKTTVGLLYLQVTSTEKLLVTEHRFLLFSMQ